MPGNKKSLCQLLLRNEKKSGRKVYLRQPVHGVWHELTWKQVILQARKVAAFLHYLRLKKGSHISIISKNCAEWFITDFGIHLAGMVSVPLFPNQHKESIDYVLEHAEVKLIFIGKLDDHHQVHDSIPKNYLTVAFDYHHDIHTHYRWADVLAMEPLKDIKEPGADDLYTIIYSSGTSGLPKGAMYTNQSIANYLHLFQKDMLRIRKLTHYKLVSYLPLAHVYERSAIQLGSIMIPCTVSFIESLDKFAENLKEIQPTFFTAVPRIWAVFQQKIQHKIPSPIFNFLLKVPFISHAIKKKVINSLGFEHCYNYFSGASPLPVSILNFFNRLGIKIQEGYGQTENMAYATLSLLKNRKPGFVGTPRFKVSIHKSKEGELEMYSPCLMSGYYKNKEATKNAFTKKGWLKTGDLVTITDKKEVKILGRISENFKNQSGEFIAPTPIENRFESNELIEQLCLVGHGLSHNVLVVVLSKEATIAKSRREINEALQRHLHTVNAQLLRFEKISHIIVAREAWSSTNDMLTPTLKVKRKEVEKHYGGVIAKALRQRRVVVWED